MARAFAGFLRAGRTGMLTVGVIFCTLLPSNGRDHHTYEAGCPPVFFEPIGDLPGASFENTVDDSSADGKRVVGGSSTNDPAGPNDGGSAPYAHATRDADGRGPAPGIISGKHRERCRASKESVAARQRARRRVNRVLAG